MAAKYYNLCFEIVLNRFKFYLNMRAVKQITPGQIRRVKYMLFFAVASTAVQYLAGRLADAKIKDRDFEGPYIYGGTEYD